jgi:hypothetical protein
MFSDWQHLYFSDIDRVKDLAAAIGIPGVSASDMRLSNGVHYFKTKHYGRVLCLPRLNGDQLMFGSIHLPEACVRTSKAFFLGVEVIFERHQRPSYNREVFLFPLPSHPKLVRGFAFYAFREHVHLPWIAWHNFVGDFSEDTAGDEHDEVMETHEDDTQRGAVMFIDSRLMRTL